MPKVNVAYSDKKKLIKWILLEGKPNTQIAKRYTIENTINN